MWKPTRPPFRAFKKEVFNKAAKVSQFVYQIGESPMLRTSSENVSVDEITSTETKQKIAYLKKCLLMYRKVTGYGRGLAAVQVGIPQRFSVIYTPEGQLFVIINPEISKKSKKQYIFTEGCMSASPIFVPVIRPAWIEFSYYNECGQKQYWDTKDDTDTGRMMNRVFHHEIAHMEGIINIDIASAKEIILESDPHFYDTADFIEV